jgi:hypothetical protein
VSGGGPEDRAEEGEAREAPAGVARPASDAEQPVGASTVAPEPLPPAPAAVEPANVEPANVEPSSVEAVAAAVAPPKATTSTLWKWIGALLTVVAAVAVAYAAYQVAPDRGMRFRASSAQSGYQVRGWTGILLGDNIFFHTKREARPWIEIDVGNQRLRRVHVVNRAKHRERALPLVLEIRGEDGKWREVGRKTEIFTQTTFEFPAVRTKRIRLKVDTDKGMLHLRQVRVD